MFLDFLSKKKNGNGNGNGNGHALKEYRLEAFIQSLSENMVKQTELIRQMREDNKETQHAVVRIETKIDAVRS